jgi:hypothetical protein
VQTCDFPQWLVMPPKDPIQYWSFDLIFLTFFFSFILLIFPDDNEKLLLEINTKLDRLLSPETDRSAKAGKITSV